MSNNERSDQQKLYEFFEYLVKDIDYFIKNFSIIINKRDNFEGYFADAWSEIDIKYELISIVDGKDELQFKNNGLTGNQFNLKLQMYYYYRKKYKNYISEISENIKLKINNFLLKKIRRCMIFMFNNASTIIGSLKTIIPEIEIIFEMIEVCRKYLTQNTNSNGGMKYT